MNRQFWNDFKKFAIKGSVVDLAVGVIIGSAFGKIVTSLVNDVLMPPIGLLINGINFSDLKVNLKSSPSGPVAINYGTFIQNIIDFIIVALAIFTFVELISKLRRKEEKKVAPTKEEKLLAEIRDILKAQAKEK